METKKIKKLLFLILFFGFAIFTNNYHVSAETISFKEWSDVYTCINGGCYNQKMGIHHLNGNTVFCADRTRTLVYGNFKEVDSPYSQEDVDRLGLYAQYLSQLSDGLDGTLNFEIMQHEVWLVTNSGTDWEDGYYNRWDRYSNMKSYYEKYKNNYTCKARYYEYADGNGQPLIYFTCEKSKTATCEENASLPYGTCYIKITDKSGTRKEKVSCNTYSEKGKSTYNDNGDIITLNKLCPYKKELNYYIESSCQTCNSKSDKAAIEIQDMNDWLAIQNSGSNNSTKVKNQYETIGACQGTIYCRQEYKVVFPNLNNYSNKEFNVSTGRYFTVNNQTSPFANGVSNFGPIYVKKTKECTFVPDTDEEGNPVTSLAEQKGCVESHVQIGGFGSINLEYQEKKGKKYHVDKDLVINESRTSKLEKKWEGGVYSLKQTKHYELPSNIYRYIEIGTATPENGNYAGDNRYTDLKTSTLPVSFENYATKYDKGGGTIALEYSLPGGARNGGLKKAYEGGSSYFGNQERENIYKKYINAGGNLTDPDEIKQAKESLCAQDYGYSTSKSSEFYKCASDKQNSAVSNCNNIKNKNSGNGYVCDVTVCYWGKKVCPNGKCQDECTDTCTHNNAGHGKWSSYYWDGKECCEIGKTCDKNKITGECKVSGGKYYDAVGNEITKEEYQKQCTCKILDNGVYLGNNGQKLYNLEQYYRQCPSNESCPSDKQAECPSNTWINGDPCLRCPSGACPMPGGVCPGSGGIDIIYRPIDLKNPFPGQTGSTSKSRQTGDNWCSYSVTDSRITYCSGNQSSKSENTKKQDNATVYYQIQKNRGVNDYDVYKKEALYEITLDSKAINAIKKENRKGTQSYDDWSDIKCGKNGCVSEFLKKSFGGTKVTGKCMKTGANKYNCAEG